MCGIVGYVGHREAWPIIFQGLQHLEYRGYDSAGIGVLTTTGELDLRKSAGKVRELATPKGISLPAGTTGVGHTRWATHGIPNGANAHPHTDCTNRLVLVHNGIVENYQELKRDLMSKGHRFTSDTDTEVIVHLIEDFLASGRGFEASVLHATSLLIGTNTIGVAHKDEPGKLLALKQGHAGGMVIAQGEGEAMFSSDLAPLVSFATEVFFLDGGEMAVITRDDIKITNTAGRAVSKDPVEVPQDSSWVDKGGHEHFMFKEILEQPQSLSSALRGRVDFGNGLVTLGGFPLSDIEVKQLQRVVLIGCGTSLNACMVGRNLMEDLAGIPTAAESSSEYRYRNSPVDNRTLVISVGQSGETADTLAAMAEVKSQGGRLITICNSEGSQATRIAEATLYMGSGLEVGVASTKTFVASLAILALIGTYLGQVNGRLDEDRRRNILNELAKAPNLAGRILADLATFRDLAHKYSWYNHFLYLGRGLTYPIAVEGALKMKEVSYIHAEGYAAGEMKHGPIALIDDRMPVVAVVPKGLLYDKMINSIKEVKARMGTVIAIASEGDEDLAAEVDDIIYIPRCQEILTPILAVIPLQLLAYYVALKRGCDVDQPRNLAKSVTVE